LTTAASIWLTAAIGLLCGLGEVKLAVIATGLAIIVLLLDWTGYKVWPNHRQRSEEEPHDVPPTRDGE
jgi:putative Mg2+ transporter-C (MgtC) family protein